MRRTFNDFIRARDFSKGCISCGKRFTFLTAGWQAGHYYTSASSWAAMDFDEENVNGQCAPCNMNEGSAQGYLRGLIKRYGPDILERLEKKKAEAHGKPWGVFEYKAKIVHYAARLAKIGLPARAI